ncbi:MAG: pyridoxal-phosphate dependent enzyme [Gemmatimonadetes bacterium]|nr:pyridoxal-phosphate dependent enzyme [Gemmatimonadota bacterium]
MTLLAPPALADLRAAAERIRGHAVRTPLIRLEVPDAPADIWLKLENLQPIGSFKIRGACNALRLAPGARLEHGVYTASAGNMAQGVGWMARALGVPWSVVVPDHAPETKLSAIRRLGGRIIALPFDEWWRVIEEHRYPGLDGWFVHPVCDPAVIAGNGTIGLEIAEDLPDVDAVVVPFGGGGLSSGIAAALRTLCPHARVWGAEVETAAPLAAAFAAGRPVQVAYTPTFIDGIGSRSVLPAMWPLARELLAGSLVSSVDGIAAAVRLLIEHSRVVAEGAGAAGVAAALAGKAGNGRVVCVVSGGNIDRKRLAEVLWSDRAERGEGEGVRGSTD